MSTESSVRSFLQNPIWDKGTNALFVGRASGKGAPFVSTTAEKGDPSGIGTDYDVRVERVFRGDLPERIVLQSRGGGSECGFSMSDGVREVVIARRTSGDRYESNLCSVFRATAGDGTPSPVVDWLERLAPGKPPRPADDGSKAPRSADDGIDWIPASIAVAALSAGLAAIVLFVRRRSDAPPT